jgi:hypothetical protein
VCGGSGRSENGGSGFGPRSQTTTSPRSCAPRGPPGGSSFRAVVRDPEGNFWIVPPIENAWESREPFCPAEDNYLESIPGHYKYVLGLPF